MKTKSFLKVGALILGSALLLTLNSCKKKEGCTDPTASNYDAEAEKDDGSCVTKVAAAYIGSENCKSCHTTNYDDWFKTGHPYKLNKVSGAAPVYPYSTVPSPVSGYTWADITYVIGGSNWKARFLDKDGYIITGSEVQYNVADKSWSAYHETEAPGTKKYDCGKCHTTGWVSVADGGSPQDGLAGMDGQFAEGGIGCEACHGKGAVHADSKLAKDITVNKTAAFCGTCHYRDAGHKVEASGGFIKHHEQYDELMAGGHDVLSCVDCHDPHKTVLHDQTGGITKTCESCHSTKTTSKHVGSLACTDCHMPKASKSALKENIYTGDVKTHIFTINPASTGYMFETTGTKTYVKDDYGVTLDYVCYKCHKDANGVGGSGSTKSMAELSARATGFHD